MPSAQGINKWLCTFRDHGKIIGENPLGMKVGTEFDFSGVFSFVLDQDGKLLSTKEYFRPGDIFK